MSKTTPTKKTVAPLKTAAKRPLKDPAKQAPLLCTQVAKPAVKRAQEELRVKEVGSGEWAWAMYRGGRFVARGEVYSKKGNAQRAAEKFNALLAVPMNVVA